MLGENINRQASRQATIRIMNAQNTKTGVQETSLQTLQTGKNIVNTVSNLVTINLTTQRK